MHGQERLKFELWLGLVMVDQLVIRHMSHLVKCYFDVTIDSCLTFIRYIGAILKCDTDVAAPREKAIICP